MFAGFTGNFGGENFTTNDSVFFSDQGLFLIKDGEKYQDIQKRMYMVKDQLEKVFSEIVEHTDKNHREEINKTVNKIINFCEKKGIEISFEDKDLIKEGIYSAIGSVLIDPKKNIENLLEDMYPSQCLKKASFYSLETAKNIVKNLKKDIKEKTEKFNEVTLEMAKLSFEEEQQIIFPLINTNMPEFTELVRTITGFYKSKDIRYAIFGKEDFKKIIVNLKEIAKNSGNSTLSMFADSLSRTLNNLPEEFNDILYKEVLPTID
jgi:hypothetical protein